MKPNQFPAHITAKLDELAQTAEYLAEQVSKTRAVIAGARQRLSGGFQKDQEWHDLNATLQQLVGDQSILERKLRDAEYVLGDCRAWLDGLPNDAVLELAAPAKPDDDLDLHSSCQRIDDAKDEVRRLHAVPVPSADIRERIEAYVSTLARPKVSGIATGQQLRVSWPSDIPALWASLQPDATVAALMKEVERHANTPMPLPQRKRRIAGLEAQIDTLQRQALALGAGTSGLPPAVVLGVRIAETKATRAA